MNKLIAILAIAFCLSAHADCNDDPDNDRGTCSDPEFVEQYTQPRQVQPQQRQAPRILGFIQGFTNSMIQTAPLWNVPPPQLQNLQPQPYQMQPQQPYYPQGNWK